MLETWNNRLAKQKKMYKEISIEEVNENSDVMTGFKFCIQGAIENLGMNGDSLHDWYDGAHIATTYLVDNEKLNSSQMNEIAEKGYAAHFGYKHKESKKSEVDLWLNKLQDVLNNDNEHAIDFVEDESQVDFFKDLIKESFEVGFHRVKP